MCSHEARSSVKLSFVIKAYISVEVLSFRPCNQNVCSNKILFFFGLSLFSCLLLRSNFCFLLCRNSVVCFVSTLHMCYSVWCFCRIEKKKNSSLVSSSIIDST